MNGTPYIEQDYLSTSIEYDTFRWFVCMELMNNKFFWHGSDVSFISRYSEVIFIFGQLSLNLQKKSLNAAKRTDFHRSGLAVKFSTY